MQTQQVFRLWYSGCSTKLAHSHRVSPQALYGRTRVALIADSGSWTESTYAANESDFHRLYLRQRILRDVSALSLSHELLGKPVGMPLALAPVGMCGMQHADGEIHAARAAEKYGVPFILSTMSVCSIEDVAAAVDKPFWFQVFDCHNILTSSIPSSCSVVIHYISTPDLVQNAYLDSNNASSM